jgi:hypothetical protein
LISADDAIDGFRFRSPLQISTLIEVRKLRAEPCVAVPQNVVPIFVERPDPKVDDAKAQNLFDRN